MQTKLFRINDNIVVDVLNIALITVTPVRNPSKEYENTVLKSPVVFTVRFHFKEKPEAFEKAFIDFICDDRKEIDDMLDGIERVSQL